MAKTPKVIRFKTGSIDFKTGSYLPCPYYPNVGKDDFVEIEIKHASAKG